MFGRLLLLGTVGGVVNEHNKLRINLKENSYDIIIEHGLLSSLGALVSQKFGKPKTHTATGYILEFNENDRKVDIQLYEQIAGTTILEGLELSKNVNVNEENICFRALKDSSSNSAFEFSPKLL